MFEFTDDCIIGIDQIDDEHRYLFDVLNRAYFLVTTDFQIDRYQDLKTIIEELDNYAEQHFAHEEAYMMKICDPELILQRAQHSFFREKIREFDFINIDFEEEQQRVLSELVSFLAKWLYRHILSSDILIGKLPSLEEWMVKENPCEFTDNYLVGIDLIDKEHKELFRIVDKANHLIKSYNASSSYDKIIEILNELKEYTKEHFGDEEEFMESIHYKGIEAQKRAHEAFIDKLENIDLNEIENNPNEYLQNLLEFLLGWLINHILHTDKKIAEAL
ncbi:MAG: hemerythrin family protein [Lachnospiraceae bacterium]|jgi:hemerythrin-like metal-binding domain/hemerythrin-like metal-binding domain|nr:hemerythrin family protein [Lachnospiraceae bacterium]MCI9401235.1 hemerythrin family protein [Lachnospiraceae bacterium]MCX4377750.1 hemerythrin family protein [Lachnospiraceae bacterium]